MNPHTHSTPQPSGLDRLAAVVDQLAAEDPDALPDTQAAQRVLVLRRLIERLEGQWLRELAGVDGRGAAGTDQGTPVESTAAWLRTRTRRGHPDAHQRVRVARALHRGPLEGTAHALATGQLSYQHAAAALTRATQPLPPPPPPRPRRCCWTPPAAWTHPGGARSSATWSRWPTPTAPPSAPSASTTAAGGG